jgi:NAD/NADP transhydrogenase alpha subunit
VVEAGAGLGALIPDELFTQAGATIGDPWPCDVVAKVNPPTAEEIGKLREGSTLIGFLAPLTSPETVEGLAKADVQAFAMEAIPRISRAQSMDALSSQANVAGYKAVLLAAEHSTRFFPMLTTAAGTVKPATALVLGHRGRQVQRGRDRHVVLDDHLARLGELAVAAALPRQVHDHAAGHDARARVGAVRPQRLGAARTDAGRRRRRRAELGRRGAREVLRHPREERLMETGLLANLAILVLAGFVGFAVISKVPNTLHTPLMSGTNAIHGIVLLGGLIVLGHLENPSVVDAILLVVAIAFGMINVIGGFLVTDRMLGMFKAKPQAPAAEKIASNGKGDS